MNTCTIYSMEIKKTKIITAILISVLIVLVLFYLSIVRFYSSGFEFFNLIDVFPELFNKGSRAYRFITNDRLPRVIACILVGAGLSVAGLLTQTMFNNNLATPSIIGINSGGALAFVLLSVISTHNMSSLDISIVTFIGAILSALLIYAIARKTGASRGKLILAGLAITKLFQALIDTICYMDTKALDDKVTFSLGSFYRVTNDKLLFSAIIIIIGLIAAILISKKVSILSLGDEVAHSLGLNVKLTRFLVLLIVALLSSGSVALVGLLSFLGLIVPHITRKIFGEENFKKLIIMTIIVGAAFTVLCDFVAGILLANKEIPVGIIMSVIGVPFFMFLIFEKGGRRIAKNK